MEPLDSGLYIPAFGALGAVIVTLVGAVKFLYAEVRSVREWQRTHLEEDCRELAKAVTLDTEALSANTRYLEEVVRARGSSQPPR